MYADIAGAIRGRLLEITVVRAENVSVDQRNNVCRIRSDLDVRAVVVTIGKAAGCVLDQALDQ